MATPQSSNQIKALGVHEEFLSTKNGGMGPNKDQVENEELPNSQIIEINLMNKNGQILNKGKSSPFVTKEHKKVDI